jgi:hypothetical protein
MTEERDVALDKIFEAGRGLARSPGDAIAMATDALTRLEAALAAAGRLGDEHEVKLLGSPSS